MLHFPILNLCLEPVSHELGVTDIEVGSSPASWLFLTFLHFLHTFPMTDRGKNNKLKLIKIVIKEENQFTKQICCRSWQNQAWANLKQGQGQSSSPFSIETSSCFLLGCVISNNWTLWWPWCQWRWLGLNVFSRICGKKKNLCESLWCSWASRAFLGKQERGLLGGVVFFALHPYGALTPPCPSRSKSWWPTNPQPSALQIQPPPSSPALLFQHSLGVNGLALGFQLCLT